MEEYYKSLLSSINKQAEAEAEHDDNNSTDSTNDDSESITNITGGETSNGNILIYSFVDIYKYISSGENNNSHVLNLEDEIVKIIQNVHKQLPNQYITSDDIACEIVKQLNDRISDNIPKYNIFYLPIIAQLCSFNIEACFANNLKSINKIIFINPTLKLMTSQIEQHYKQHPYRLELNQYINYILKRYHQVISDSMPHSIQYSKQTFKELFERIKSAFIDENDFNSLIETIDHSLITKQQSNATNATDRLYIIHKLIDSSKSSSHNQLYIFDLKNIDNQEMKALIDML